MDGKDFTNKNDIFFEKYFLSKKWKPKLVIDNTSYTVGKSYDTLYSSINNPHYKYFKRVVICNLKYSSRNYDNNKLFSYSHLIDTVGQKIFIIDYFYSKMNNHSLEYFAEGKAYDYEVVEHGVFKIALQAVVCYCLS